MPKRRYSKKRRGKQREGIHLHNQQKQSEQIRTYQQSRTPREHQEEHQEEHNKKHQENQEHQEENYTYTKQNTSITLSKKEINPEMNLRPYFDFKNQKFFGQRIPITLPEIVKTNKEIAREVKELKENIEYLNGTKELTLDDIPDIICHSTYRIGGTNKIMFLETLNDLENERPKVYTTCATQEEMKGKPNPQGLKLIKEFKFGYNKKNYHIKILSGRLNTPNEDYTELMVPGLKIGFDQVLRMGILDNKSTKSMKGGSSRPTRSPGHGVEGDLTETIRGRLTARPAGAAARPAPAGAAAATPAATPRRRGFLNSSKKCSCSCCSPTTTVMPNFPRKTGRSNRRINETKNLRDPAFQKLYCNEIRCEFEDKSQRCASHKILFETFDREDGGNMTNRRKTRYIWSPFCKYHKCEKTSFVYYAGSRWKL